MGEFLYRNEKFRAWGDPLGPDGWINRRWLGIAGTGCWRWQGPMADDLPRSTTRRHGYVNVRRLMVQEHYGVILPFATHIKPLCGDVECVRPDHLAWAGKDVDCDNRTAG